MFLEVGAHAQILAGGNSIPAGTTLIVAVQGLFPSYSAKRVRVTVRAKYVPNRSMVTDPSGCGSALAPSLGCVLASDGGSDWLKNIFSQRALWCQL